MKYGLLVYTVCSDLYISAFYAADFRSVNVKALVEKNAQVVHIPGFKYDDFDRAGIRTICICA